MSLRTRFLAGLARQLGHPQGLAGRIVGARLDRANARMVAAAVDATRADPGATVADVGFGGGAGLALLLDRVGPGGIVHGVEISEAMRSAWEQHGVQADSFVNPSHVDGRSVVVHVDCEDAPATVGAAS